MMARLRRTEGFAMLELLVSVFVLSVLTTVAIRIPSVTEDGYHVFPDQYLRIQSEAILTGETRDYEDEISEGLPSIHFNQNGNINQARTIPFGTRGTVRQIIVELGGGRLVFR
jgi:competence protein ComGC